MPYNKDIRGRETNPTKHSLNSLIMRKIEQQMCAAIQKNINWQSGNTSVHFNEETGESIVRLHGNKIAVVSDNDMTIFDGGYQSNTTKSRLNALCDEFCIAGEGVFQKNYQWFVRKFVGAINGQNVFKNEEFESGYIFAWSPNYSFIMKIILLAIIGCLLWTNDEARQFTADRLDDASEFVRPQRDRNEFTFSFWV